ncbi:peptidylprolyl isomerase [bacterium]|nr:peptidylprolyl isomerase [bacterium]
MKNYSLVLVLFFALLIQGVNLFGQDTDHVLVKIGDNEYTVGEFDFIFNKNNSFSQEPKSKEEYVELFVNYKLKVLEAKAQGLDTLPSYKKELTYYEKELAKPYLTDNNITEQLYKEAYSRMKQEVDASHILIRLEKDAAPEDTLEAYNKIADVRKQIVEGADFGELAELHSEDPSAKENQGNLGYFSAFSMVYPFESGAFNTPVGEVSDIVRTSFGYHIIKVNDIRENGGEIRVAHIMKTFPKEPSQEVIDQKKNEIDSVYQLILSGGDFAELAKEFSEDKRSAPQGGEMQWFSSSNMVPSFAKPAFALQNDGDISEPIKTQYGWHVIKRLEHKGIGAYDEVKADIEKKIARDERAFKGQKMLIAKLKKDYNFQVNQENVNKIKDFVITEGVNDSLLQVNFGSSNIEILNIADKVVKADDFIAELVKTSSFSESSFDKFLTGYYENQLIAYEKSLLEIKYPDYKYLLQEYRDGLLIFEISQNEVWNKAAGDSVGIATYFEANKEKYFEPEKFSGDIYKVASKKEYKKLTKILKLNKGLDKDSLLAVFSANELDVKVENGDFSKGENYIVDKSFFEVKKPNSKKEDEYSFGTALGEIIPKKMKVLDETRGQVISDFQAQLEKEWIASLRTKFNPEILKEMLKYSKSKDSNK